MKICIPELNQPIVQTAIESFPDLEFVPAPDLAAGCELVKTDAVDTMISGLEFSSRAVLLAYRDFLPLKSPYFSSSFICEREDYHFCLADGGVNKLPTKEQLLTIVEDSAQTFATYYAERPKIALLSYSTAGSGGKNPDLEKYRYVIDQIQSSRPDWLIEGEMQLDAAINPSIAAKKVPQSKIAGHANVLITPDLNSGNLLYKSLEQFADFTIAGPIIQGFVKPLADLSRGSSVEDIILTIKVMQKICKERS